MIPCSLINIPIDWASIPLTAPVDYAWVPTGDVYFWMAPAAPIAVWGSTVHGGLDEDTGKRPGSDTAQDLATGHTRTRQNQIYIRPMRRYGAVTKVD